MSNSSDNEEFFDAEDVHSPDYKSRHESAKGAEFVIKSPRRSRLSTDSEQQSEEKLRVSDKPAYGSEDTQTFENESNKTKQSWYRFKELRQRMQTEEEDVSNNSPVDSQVSSVEDVFAGPSSKMLHPFRVIEHDTMSVQSMTSLGRVGRILSGTSEQNALDNRDEQLSASTSTLSERNVESSRSRPILKQQISQSEEKYAPPSTAPFLQEPDVIASTKNSINQPMPSELKSASLPAPEEPAPIAPPRRKKKLKIALQQVSLAKSTNSSTSTLCKENIPVFSSQTTIENLTKELEHSLDIKLASKGEHVVKPQDEESRRASQNGNEKSEPVRQRSVSHMITCRSNATYPLSPGTSGTTSLARNSSTYPLSSVSSHSVGGTRAGLGLRFGVSPQRNKERRKSTGDEKQLPPQLNMFVRTRTESGKQLSDMEILEQVTVLNLDTGERVPLSIAEDKLPQCINPLSLHIMRLTSEYVSNSSLEKRKESDEESVDSKKSFATTTDGDTDSVTVIKRATRLRRLLGSTVRRTVNRAKTIAQEVSHVRHKEEMDIRDDVNQQNEPFKLRASNNHKGPYEFQSLQHVQELNGEHVGPVWCMKFSTCGRLLATAGQDRILRIWVLRNAYTYFQEMRTKYNAEKVSPTPSQESLVSQQSFEDPNCTYGDGSSINEENTPFMPKPFCVYTGHTSDLLDVSWSKNYFVLSSSMDKTVRLWHISRKECLCCFQHIDFVTAICFHPRDDRYFLSGSLDGKLRLWNIPDKKVAVWNEIDGSTKLITAANFCQNGKFAVVGSYDGRCLFFTTEQLRYHTQIHVRSTRGKNARGRKISGIEPMPGEGKILVTSNDSRIRLYDLVDLNVSCKYKGKGYVNVSSQIRASFSHDGKFIICGSENQSIYLWKTHHDYSKFQSVRRDRNDFWEGIKAHTAVVTCAIFAPNPSAIIQQMEEKRKENEAQSDDPLLSQHTQGAQGYVFVSADFSGCIRVFLNKTKPKHSSLPASAMA